MGKYKKCPRCELNWIPAEDEYCDVCKAELGLGGIELIDDEEEEYEELICPICKTNYIEPGDAMCEACKEKKLGALVVSEFESDVIKTDENVISFDELEAEEGWIDDEPVSFDDNDDFANDSDYIDSEEEEEEIIDEQPDDLEDDFVYEVDENDFLEDEEEDEEFSEVGDDDEEF